MQTLIQAFADDLNAAPEAEKISNMWERGLLTYGEAVKMLIEAAENNRYFFIIQYKGYTANRYHDYSEIQYTWSEAKEELNRLRDTAPGFSWRYRKELKP